MNCEWLQSACRFDCLPILGLHGERGVEIGTPFSYADGTAITLYAMEHGEHLVLSDNGDMLAHLSSVGLKSGQRMKTLRDRVEKFGLTLTAEGDVRALLPIQQSQYMVPVAVSALLSVAEWEREQLGLDEQTQDLADEAEILLREWKPNAVLERRAKVRGQSRKEHLFDFLFDGEYIDVIAPNHTATGATMRKAGDVKNSPYLDGREIRVVIDDRIDPDRADIERQILGSLVKAMTLTKLQSLGKLQVRQ